MKLDILCKDFELTDAIKSYLTEKLETLTKYIGKQNANDEIIIHARLGKTSNHHHHGKIFYTEVSIHTSYKTFGARIEAESIYESIDLLRDDLADNIVTYKDKTRSKQIKESIKFKQQLHESE
jgi:ribosomal subunit interface protein